VLWVKTLDPLGSGGGGTFWCRFLLEGVVLEPTVYLSVAGGVLALTVKLPGDKACVGGVHIVAGCNVC
jgi:hypothetical protein